MTSPQDPRKHESGMSEFGPMNARAVGTLMKEAVRRAIIVIRAHRFNFEATVKGVGDHGGPDLVTTADHAAQHTMTELLQQWFPNVHICAEEDDLRDPLDVPEGLWFSVDPLDGTAAFVRRASHGIGSMIALMRGTEILGAVVGDVMTQELYATSPGGDAVHRISELGFPERLVIDTGRPLDEQWVLLRDAPDQTTETARALVWSDAPLFRGIEVAGDSIGLGMARLWKGEVGGALLPPRAYTPWDLNPIVVLSQRMGFVFLEVRGDGALIPWTPEATPVCVAVEVPLLVVHHTRFDEVRAWQARQ